MQTCVFRQERLDQPVPDRRVRTQAKMLESKTTNVHQLRALPERASSGRLMSAHRTPLRLGVRITAALVLLLAGISVVIHVDHDSVQVIIVILSFFLSSRSLRSLRLN